jgi:hypothetical protein
VTHPAGRGTPGTAVSLTANPADVVTPLVGQPLTQEPAGLAFEKKRQLLIEWTAASLAWGVLATFASTVLVFGVYGIAGDTGNAIELLKTVLPVVSTPLGIALGYYFTRQRGE